MRTTILNDFMVLTGVTVIAALALLFASRSTMFSDPNGTSSSCGGPNTLEQVINSQNADEAVIRLQPPGSSKKRIFRVENRTDHRNAMTIVRHQDLSETDAKALRASGLYEEMGLRIANVQICYKAHISDNSHGQMRLGFTITQRQNLALVTNVDIIEGKNDNKYFNNCIIEIFEGMAFMPPLDESQLPEAGAVMVLYPVEVL